MTSNSPINFMLIGGDFNSRARQLLVLLAKLTDNDADKKVAVEVVADQLKLDRTELKNLLEYLENKELATIASIGGPFLYGHVKITPKGISKAAKLK